MAHYDATDLQFNLNPTQLKPLFKINSLRHGSEILLNWAVIIGTAYLAATYLNPLTYLIALLIIGARMHALAILMHDAAHYRFLKNRKWNDLITDITTMYPLFLTIEKYRTNHLQHHKHLNTEEDPDWVSKLPKKEFQFPKTKSEFILGVLSYFLLIQGVKDAIWFVTRFNVLGNQPKKTNSKKANPIPQLLFYGLLIFVLTTFALWKFFLLFWVVPYFSTFLMFQYIRSVAEHFGELEYDHLLRSTRTVKTNFFERFLIAPHNVGYHIEHHLYPGVPYYNLPKLHQLLMETSTFRENAHLTQGYLSGMLRELSKEPEKNRIVMS